MSGQLTDWFPGDVKPVRPGVYETDNHGDPLRCFQYWDGEDWGYAALWVGSAYALRDLKSAHQNDKWRGLAADPNAVIADSQTDDHTGICEVTE